MRTVVSAKPPLERLVYADAWRFFSRIAPITAMVTARQLKPTSLSAGAPVGVGVGLAGSAQTPPVPESSSQELPAHQVPLLKELNCVLQHGLELTLTFAAAGRLAGIRPLAKALGPSVKLIRLEV